MSHHIHYIKLSLLCLILISLCPTVFATDTATVASEWRLLGGNADVWHYSPLDTISDHNIARLGLAWKAEIPSKDGLVGNPLVAEGIVYQSASLGRIYANDIRTGKLLWQFQPEINFSHVKSFTATWSTRFNRGLALLDDKVFVASGDCRLFAVDRSTGKQVWSVAACDADKQYGITQAPRVGDGKVFIGNNCLDSGSERGYVDAYDADTGKRAWRFYTVPGDPSKPFESPAMEMASKTWGTGYWEKTHGCVSPWDAMTYDEKLNLLYIGTGSAAPWNPAERAADAGDELFTNSIVAVNASSGEYVWHYQTVQHDAWDLDATCPITIAELPVNNRVRRVILTAQKNGFFYVLDASTGKMLSANNFTDVNWASHIDADTGRPVTIPDARYWERPDEATVVSPGPAGAHNWHANSFSPETGLMYMPIMIIPTLLTPDPESKVAGMNIDFYYAEKGDPKWEAKGELVAWDPLTQQARWRVNRALPWNGGTLATAGNLVFQGTSEGFFEAFSAETGELLWSFNTHGSIQAAPTTVEVDGEQLILIASGNAGSMAGGPGMARYASTPSSRSPSRLLAFKLGGTGSIPATIVREFPRPPLPRPSASLAEKGGLYFQAEWCTGCHGFEAEAAGSSLPDLRYASGKTHEQFVAIVLGGAMLDKGMPAFPHIAIDELKAIQAYILNEAWRAYDNQEANSVP